MNEFIPPPRRPEDMSPIASQSDLDLHWRALMGELGFSRPALWLTLLSIDGYADARITKVDEVPDRPDELVLDDLMGICGELLDLELPGGSVAFLYSRPGTRFVTDDDRAWARGLLRAARKSGVPCQPVHLANDEELRVFAPDDLGLVRQGGSPGHS